MVSKSHAFLIVRSVLQILALIVFLFPLFWLLTASLKLPVDAVSIPPVWFAKPSISNYVTILNAGFSQYLLHSFVVALSVTLISLILGYPAAYALARYTFKGRSQLGFWFLSLYMFPPLAIVLPYLLILKTLHLVDTPLGLILAHLTFILPLVICLLQRFIRDVPVEFEEAAAVDGAGLLRRLLQVTFPMILPGITTTAIFAFMMSWNEFAFALILAPMSAKTLPVASQGLASWAYINWGEVSAAGVIIVAPILILLVIIRKQLVRGFSFGLK